MSASWTDPRVATLKEMWIGGASGAEIAKALGGVTRNAVIGKAHRLGLASGDKPQNKAARQPVRLAASAPKRFSGAPSAIYGGDPRTSPLQKKLDAIAANERARVLDAEILSEPKHSGAVVDLLDLGPSACKWPVGSPGADGFGFCGREQSGLGPYCTAHAKRAFVPMSTATRVSVEKQAVYYANRTRR